jgi:DNA-binding ferritin-like protein (Dps family)
MARRGGGRPPARKPKYRKLENRIRKLKEQYNNGTKTLYQYWSAISHVIGSFE